MNKKIEKFIYRPELDGLRGIAVIAVVIYHAQIEFLGKNNWLSGGYIGVDIFFVLSGYLITNSILKELTNKNSFDLINFYQRRLRRILPILLIVLLFAFIFAWRLFIINDLIEFGRSGISIFFLGSNFFFHNVTTEYGAESSFLKPLLHTWSLSIELQFYLIFPILFLFTHRFCKNNVPIIFSLLLISLQFSEVLINKNLALNYYHSLSRLWEFNFGSLLSYYYLSKNSNKENFLTSLPPILGIYLIIYSFFSFDENTNHPGSITLIPLIGTFLVIIFSSNNELIGKVLGSKPIALIGKISYSVYLWHYPLFAFYRVYDPDLSNKTKIYLLIFSLFISLLSYLFIEKPFQKKLSNKLFYSIISFLLVITLSIYYYLGYLINEELWYRHGNQDLVSGYKLIKDTQEENVFLEEKCKFNIISGQENEFSNKFSECRAIYGKAVFVLGDSHAQNILNALVYSQRFPFLIGITQGGCRPYACKENYTNQYNFFNEKVIPLTNANDLIIFHQSGSYLIKDINGGNNQDLIFKEGKYKVDLERIMVVNEYLSKISEKTKSNLIWLSPFIEYRNNPKEIISALRRYGSFTKYKNINPISINAFKELEENLKNINTENYKIIIFSDFYNLNYNAEILDENDKTCFQFRDGDHFSRCGEKIMGRLANYKLIDF